MHLPVPLLQLRTDDPARALQVLCEALGSVLAKLPDTCLDVPYAPVHVAKLLVGCVREARGTVVDWGLSDPGLPFPSFIPLLAAD